MAIVPANAAALVASHNSPSAGGRCGSRLPNAWRILLAAAIVAAAPSSALAGMPALTFTEIATQRLEVISFFFMGFLACAWVIQRFGIAWRRNSPISRD